MNRLPALILIPFLFVSLRAAVKPAKRVKLPGVLNTGPYAELAPSLTTDGNSLLFQSNRPGGAGDHDLYLSVKKDGQWQKPVNLSLLNSNSFDGLSHISPAGDMILFTSNRGNEDVNNQDLYASIRKNGQWTKPVKLPAPVNTNHYDAMPAISPDGKWLYFTSSRPGGQGGMDLYRCQLLSGLKFGPVQNLGAPVNSDANETSPSILHTGKTLYFSSSRSGGQGGFDLYYAEKGLAGQWLPPVNMGPEVNTSADEMFFSLPLGADYIYTSSGSTQESTEDLYKLKIPPWLKPKPAAILAGTVLDAVTKKPLVITVGYRRGQGKKKKISTSEKTGGFEINIENGYLYKLEFNESGYFYQSREFDFSEYPLEGKKKFTQLMEPVKPGTKIFENQVFFQTGGSDLTDESKIALSNLIDFLKLNPDIQLEIRAYADRRGLKWKNQKLSQDRANRVRQYLVEAGLKPERFQAVGGGAVGPKVPNSGRVSMKKHRELQLLRRADFVLKGTGDKNE